MLTKSCKAKGRNLQNWTKDLLLKIYKNIFPGTVTSENDIRCAIMGEKGSDIKFGYFAVGCFPFRIECKNLAKFSGYKYYKQAATFGEDELDKKYLTPVVVIKANHEKPLVLVDAEYFFSLFAK